MKKQLLLAAALLTGASTGASAQTANARLAAAQQQVPATAARVAANPNFQLLQQLTQTYNNNAWADSVRVSYSRFTATNVAQRRLTERGSPRAGRALASVLRNHYTFNAAQRLVVDTAYTFNTAGTASPRYYTNYTYTAQGNVFQQTSNFRFLTTYDPYSRYTNTYDALGRLTTILSETANGAVYERDGRTLYTYTGTNLTDDQEEFQTWSATANAFLPAERYLKTYNASGNLLTEVLQSVPNGGTAYQNVRRETYTYSTSVAGRITQTVVDRWNNVAWRPIGLNTFTYDADGNLTQILTQIYTGSSTLDNYSRLLYTYQRNPLATKDARTLKADLAVAPNPVSAGGLAMLHFTLPAAAAVTATVLDALGRPVLNLPATAQAAGAHSLALPRTLLAAGLYAVRLTAGTQSQTVKLVVE